MQEVIVRLLKGKKASEVSELILNKETLKEAIGNKKNGSLEQISQENGLKSQLHQSGLITTENGNGESDKQDEESKFANSSTAKHSILGNLENGIEDLKIPRFHEFDSTQFFQLESLSITGVGLTSLENFPHLPNLKKLDLSENLIAGGLNHLHKAQLIRLVSLNLSNNKISSITEIEILGQFDNLFILEIRGCPVTSTPDFRTALFSFIPSLRKIDAVHIEEHRYYVHHQRDLNECQTVVNELLMSMSNSGDVLSKPQSSPPPKHASLFTLPAKGEPKQPISVTPYRPKRLKPIEDVVIPATYFQDMQSEIGVLKQEKNNNENVSAEIEVNNRKRKSEMLNLIQDIADSDDSEDDEFEPSEEESESDEFAESEEEDEEQEESDPVLLVQQYQQQEQLMNQAISPQKTTESQSSVEKDLYNSSESGQTNSSKTDSSSHLEAERKRKRDETQNDESTKKRR